METGFEGENDLRKNGLGDGRLPPRSFRRPVHLHDLRHAPEFATKCRQGCNPVQYDRHSKRVRSSGGDVRLFDYVNGPNVQQRALRLVLRARPGSEVARSRAGALPRRVPRLLAEGSAHARPEPSLVYRRSSP